MNSMDLDEFADFKVDNDVNGDFWFIHYPCPTEDDRRYVERIEVRPVPVKFLMVKATEHWMEYHNND